MPVTSFENLPALLRLRLRWGSFALFSLALLITGFLFLRSAWGSIYAWRWFSLAALGVSYLLWVLWRGLPENVRSGESDLLPSLGLGSSLTLLRGLFVAGLAGFLFSPQPVGVTAWIPGLLYTLAAGLDYLDGWAARAANHATRLGERLDMSLDGVGVFSAALLAVQYGQVPVPYLLVALARPLYLAGLRLWQRSGHTVHPLTPSLARRAFAGLQMGFLAVMLWPVFSPPGTHLAAALFALPFLANFIRDGLTAAGILRPMQPRAPAWRAAARGLPVLLRLSTAGLVILPLAVRLAAGPPVFASPLPVLEAAVAVLLVFGAAVRVAAILGLLLLGLHQMLAPLSPIQITMAAAYTALLYLGSGALSLWKPEDRLINRRAGERAQAPSPRDPAAKSYPKVREALPAGRALPDSQVIPNLGGPVKHHESGLLHLAPVQGAGDPDGRATHARRQPDPLVPFNQGDA